MQGGGGGGSDFTALNLGFNGSKNQIKELHHHFVHVGVFAERSRPLAGFSVNFPSRYKIDN